MDLVWSGRCYGVESSALQGLFGRKPARPPERRVRTQWHAPENQPLHLGSGNPLHSNVKPQAMTTGIGLLALLCVGVLAAIIVDQTASSQAEAEPQAMAQPAPKPVEAKVSQEAESPKPELQSPEQKNEPAAPSPAATAVNSPAPVAPAPPTAATQPKLAASVAPTAPDPTPAVIPADDPRWARAAADNAAAVAALNRQVPPPLASTIPAVTAFAESGPEIGGEKIPIPTAKPIGDPVVTAAIAGSAVNRPIPVPSDPALASSDEDAKPKAARQGKIRTAVNMRSRPADEGSVITVVPANATVGVVGCKSWCEIVFKNRRGFVYKGFVR